MSAIGTWLVTWPAGQAGPGCVLFVKSDDFTLDGEHSSPGRYTHSVTALYVSSVIIHTKQTGRHENDLTAHGYELIYSGAAPSLSPLSTSIKVHSHSTENFAAHVCAARTGRTPVETSSSIGPE